MPERLSFDDEIAKNKLKSIALLSLIFLFFIALGYVIAQFFDPSFFFVIMIISIVFSLSYTLFSYYNSGKIAVASARAIPANRTEHSTFFHAAENMALASGLPTPKLYVMQSEEINAFASGRNPQNAVVCVTTGALKKLTKQELEGVIAHEMAHVANYDIRYMTIATIAIGLISIMAEIFLRSLWMSNTDRDNKGNAILIVIGIALAILAPLITQLVYLAISRKREYTADATGAKFTRYPQGLANALKKIKNEHVPRQETKKFAKALAPMFISNPFKNVAGLFATHPPIDERIRRLESM